MGTRWGVNRTVAQIHALLYISPKPLTAEEIAGTLSVARSNVSNSLRELQSWRLIRTVHVMGDRRDYFETYKDVWELFRVVVEERKRREIDPTKAVLRECIAELEAGKGADPYAKERLSDLAEFVEQTTGWFDEVRKFSPPTLRKLMQMGTKLQKFIGAVS
ncbi:MAG: MarR family transcriptional regulator [Proteobacteria bacterium]|nr:MarR family transcriptional regulator [Pseudomonadota bacterium]